MKKYILIFSGLVLWLSTFAQDAADNTLSTVFHRVLPVPGSIGILYRSVQTADGGFASVGHLTELAEFTDDFLIEKVNNDGTTAWSKRLDIEDYDDFHDIIETNDHGVAVVGSKMGSSFISQAVVMKFDAAGVRQWAKEYSISGKSSTAARIQKDANGFLYVLGTDDLTGTNPDYIVMKIDPLNGNLLQQNTYGTAEDDLPLAFLRNSSGEFFISGSHDVTSGENIHLLKLNSSMAVDWNRLMTGPDTYFCYDLREKSNGNLVMAGRYTPEGLPYNIFLCEMEPNTGNPVWAKHYTPVDHLPCYALGLTVNTGDVLAVTGAIEDTTGGTFILTTAPDGTQNWSDRIGVVSGQYCSGYGITKTTDGGYFMCGSWSGINNAATQVLKMTASREIPCYKTAFELSTTVVSLPSQSLTITSGTGSLSAQDLSPNETTLSPLEDICQGLGISENKKSDELRIYPDPSYGTFTVSLSNLSGNSSLTVFNSLGKPVYYITNLPGSKEKSEITIGLNVPPGIYMVRVNNNDRIFTKKLIIE